jgi:hypothetical protein
MMTQVRVTTFLPIEVGSAVETGPVMGFSHLVSIVTKDQGKHLK